MMNRCLSDRVLLMLHEGEELGREREHLERCSDCDRRYRRLIIDLEQIITVLNEPAPPQHWAPRVTGQNARWGLAFAAIVTAFLCGRLMGGSIGGQLGNSGQVVAPAVVFDGSGPSDGALLTPASYGLYVDDLISTDENDPGIELANNEDTEEF
jgi:hypothetical protein